MNYWATSSRDFPGVPTPDACSPSGTMRQIDPVTRAGVNEAARIRRHQGLLPMFVAVIA
jgi:hypothetical protein